MFRKNNTIIKTMEQLTKELHKIESWFNGQGAKKLGWDELEARRRNFALQLEEEVSGVDMRSERTPKPRIVEEVEDFFIKAKATLSAKALNAQGIPGYDEPHLKQQTTLMENAYQKLERHMNNITLADMRDAVTTLKINMKAANGLAASDVPLTLEQAGGNLFDYKYNIIEENKMLGKYLIKRRDYDEKKLDGLAVELTVQWPELPEGLTNGAYEHIIAVRGELIERLVARHNKARFVGPDVPEIIGRLTDFLIHNGNGLSAKTAADAAHAYQEAIETAIVKAQAKLNGEELRQKPVSLSRQ